MKILVGCEESQAVTTELRKLGHEAYSCDILPCSGGYTEWHLQMDVFEAIKLKRWDMGIFFPDCTYLTLTGNKWFKDQPARKSGALVGAERRAAREKALEFVVNLMNAPINKIAIENPIGVIGTRIYKKNERWDVFHKTMEFGGRKPDQIIQPYYFGDSAKKTTCLWLKNLPKLQHSKEVDLFTKTITHTSEGEIHVCKSGNKIPKWYAYADKSGGQEARAKLRSKTFPGIAKAMAEQWTT